MNMAGIKICISRRCHSFISTGHCLVCSKEREVIKPVPYRILYGNNIRGCRCLKSHRKENDLLFRVVLGIFFRIDRRIDDLYFSAFGSCLLKALNISRNSYKISESRYCAAFLERQINSLIDICRRSYAHGASGA